MFTNFRMVLRVNNSLVCCVWLQPVILEGYDDLMIYDVMVHNHKCSLYGEDNIIV